MSIRYNFTTRRLQFSNAWLSQPVSQFSNQNSVKCHQPLMFAACVQIHPVFPGPIMAIEKTYRRERPRPPFLSLPPPPPPPPPLPHQIITHSICFLMVCFILTYMLLFMNFKLKLLPNSKKAKSGVDRAKLPRLLNQHLYYTA